MIGVAILGAGIGAQHLDGFRAAADWQVRLIVDQDTDRAATIAADIATAREIDVAINAPHIDVIDICLPPHLHVPVAIQALAAGKHVICEKPLATSMADINRLDGARQQTGREVFPIFQYRFGPGFVALDALRKAGLLGEPMVAALETHWARGVDYYANAWRGTWQGEQGGAVLGHAIHAHDLMTYHMGAVRAVSAFTSTRANDIETEDCAAISFELESGALATSSITLGAARDETRLRLVFDHLTATSGTDPYAPGQGAWQFTARDPVQQLQVDTILANLPSAPAGYGGAFTEIAHALNGRPNNAVQFQDGAASIELVTAIYLAARTGQRVTLPLTPHHPLHEGWHP